MATLFDMDGVALWGLGLHPFWLKVIPSVGVVQITYEILSLFFFRIYTPSTIKAVTKAKKSATGILVQIPSNPIKRGKKIRPGSRYKSCRVSERNILILAFPILWKKLPITICAPIQWEHQHTNADTAGSNDQSVPDHL